MNAPIEDSDGNIKVQALEMSPEMNKISRDEKNLAKMDELSKIQGCIAEAENVQ